MAAPYAYPPPPPSSGGGYYPPPPSGGYNAPTPGGGHYPPPPPPSYSGAPLMPPPPPTGNFGGTTLRNTDPKVMKERMARAMVNSDIVFSSASFLMWVIFMAIFEWVYHHSYSVAILLPGGLIFLIPLVLDILIVVKKWLQNERIVIAWIAGVSLKMVSESVLLVLYYVFVASNVPLSDSNSGNGTRTRRRRTNDSSSTFWKLIIGLTIWATGDFFMSIFGLAMMGRHLCSLRNPNPADGGPGGASLPLQPPPGMMG